MTKDKSDSIKKAIKEAKTKKIKVHEYLSGGDLEYKDAIQAIRLTGVFATIPAILYLLMLLGVFFLTFFIANPALQRANNSGAANTESPTLGVFILLYTILSIVQFIICYRLRNLSRPPRSIKIYLIFTLINSLLPTVLALLSGQIALPGILPLLAFVYSIISLCNFKNYADWYDHFSYPIKRKPVKRKAKNDINDNALNEEIDKEKESSHCEDIGDGGDDLL